MVQRVLIAEASRPMFADLIPEAILKDVIPARSGGEGRRTAQGQVKG